MIPFDPLFRNPHLQTIAAHLWGRDGGELRYPPANRLYQTEPGIKVLVQSQRPAVRAAGHVVMVHGMEGSGEAGYMRGLSAAGLRAGFAVHRFHMRTCGGTEHLCGTLYHAGQTSDLLYVLREMERERKAPAHLVGFSLGGNVVLKLAGELGGAAAALIQGVCAASTPLDLAACVRRLAQRQNRIYERRFVRRMRGRLCATGRYRPADLGSLRSVLDIDERITAPAFGFGNAANYYRTQSASQYLERIRVPTLLICSSDDPMIPIDSYHTEAASRNPSIQQWITAHGGHLGFLGRRPHRFWLEEAIMDWIVAHHSRFRSAGQADPGYNPE